jgi:hypothetical protein
MEKRLDKAMIGSGKPRIENNAYFTIEEWPTQAIIDHIGPIQETIWEPACGMLHLSNVLVNNGYSVYNTDLVDYGKNDLTIDFLLTDPKDFLEYKHIITNPPYTKKECEAFVRHGLKHIRQTGGLMCMLLRNEWDSASTRRDLFGDCKEYKTKLVLTKRPWWFEKKKDDSSPRHNYSWFIWDGSNTGLPTIQYNYPK